MVFRKKPMPGHLDLTNQEFANQFKTGLLDPELFTHEAHLRLAWIYIHQLGAEKAGKVVSDQIKNFVILAGAKDKYNHTLTIAAVKIVAHFIRRSHAQTFVEFAIEFPALITDFKGLLRVHYSDGICFSERAKKEFIAPDLLPF
jgi:hypothetical protein